MRFQLEPSNRRLGAMYDEPLYAVLFWFYDKVEERYGRVAAGIAQLALGLVFVAALAAVLVLLIPNL